MTYHSFLPRAIRFGALALSLLSTACLTSPSARKYSAKDTASGSTIQIEMVGGGRRVGQLLAVTDSSVTILTSGRVAVGAFRDTRSFLLADMIWLSFSSSDPKVLEKCRQLSRFPFGITAAAMKALLDSVGQTTPDVLKSDRP